VTTRNADKSLSRNAIQFGFDSEGNRLSLDVMSGGVLVVSGDKGAGKTALAMSVVVGAIRARTAVYISDHTKGSAGFVDRFGIRVQVAAKEAESARMFEEMLERVNRRHSLLQKHQVDTVGELPPRYQPMPSILIIEEFLDLIENDHRFLNAGPGYEQLFYSKERIAKSLAALISISPKLGLVVLLTASKQLPALDDIGLGFEALADASRLHLDLPNDAAHDDRSQGGRQATFEPAGGSPASVRIPLR